MTSATGAIGNNATLPGSITFDANAGEVVTLYFSYAGRPNAFGFTYADMLLDDALVYSSSGEGSVTWRRVLNGMVNVTIGETGSHTFSVRFNIGGGATSFSDGGGEWPNGGVTHTVWVGG